jgi:hypothetical protein
MADQKRLSGTHRLYLIERLSKERPDLARRVKAGKCSAYAAAVEAGIVTPRFTIYGYNPDVLAEAMRRNLPPEVIREVVWLLAQDPQ